ncbi:MAG: glucose-6-phosphate isomerase [Planctomycetota bacterium]|nr:MAG: glucose-6-phosphate isomerase [Planctomycetota bacterium]
MPESKIALYYKNVSAKVIGDEHGITDEQFKELAKKTIPAIAECNKQRKEGVIPYRDLPYNEDYPKAVKAAAEEIKSSGCENFVVLGIGGSALGNIALQTALNPYMYNLDESQRKGPRLFVFDNVDPMQLGSFLEWIGDKLDKTIFNVISKSGRTAETAAQFLVIRELLIEKLGADGFAKQVIAVTDAKAGTMRKVADDSKLRTLVVPDGVGGRFSVLSPVGLLSAAVCGIDIDAMLAGARQMDERCSKEDFLANPAAVNAAVNWHYYHRQKPISVMMPYAYALKDLSDWYRQIWAESLGKTHNRQGDEVFVGPTPVKALGTTDQHSQVQLYREGPNDKLFTFLQVKEFATDVTIGANPQVAPELGYLAGQKMSKLLNSEKLATEFALLHDKRPCMTVLFDRIDALAIGQFIYLFEVTTSIAGLLFNIDAYDQPAVELGKEATFALMGREDFADLAKEIEPFSKIDETFLA